MIGDDTHERDARLVAATLEAVSEAIERGYSPGRIKERINELTGLTLTVADRANGFAEACRALTLEREHIRTDAHNQVLAALGHCVEVLDDLKPCGHSGDEETGEHDEDCMLCRWEAAMAHAEEEGGVKGGIEPSSPLPMPDVPPPPCGKECDHGSPCILSAGHVPADRHERDARLVAATLETERG